MWHNTTSDAYTNKQFATAIYVRLYAHRRIVTEGARSSGLSTAEELCVASVSCSVFQSVSATITVFIASDSRLMEKYMCLHRNACSLQKYGSVCCDVALHILALYCDLINYIFERYFSEIKLVTYATIKHFEWQTLES